MATKKPTSPVKATTQQFIEIEDIRDDVMLLKDSSAIIVIEVGAVNFWLLSAEEQESMVYTYGSLLNSLSFPVQILIMSKMMNIASYLDYLNSKIEGASHKELLKKRLTSYQEFIKNIVKKNTVLEKRFFFVIPFNPLEMGVKSVGHLNKEYVISRAKTSLYPKRDHLLRLLARVGLKPNVLHEQELVELYYNLYNPSATGRQLAPVDTYTDTILTSG